MCKRTAARMVDGFAVDSARPGALPQRFTPPRELAQRFAGIGTRRAVSRYTAPQRLPDETHPDEHAMGIFIHFDEHEIRAWIDALLAMVRRPPVERLWVG